MGRLSVSLATLLLGGFSALGAPELRLESGYLDAGCRPADHEFRLAVRVFNVGDEVLVIEPPASDCVCVVATLDETSIPPGGSTGLRIEVNTKDFRGSVYRHVALRSNDLHRPQVAVVLHYRVRSGPRVTPPVVNLGVVPPGFRARCSFAVEPCSGRSVRVEEVLADSPNIRVLDYGPQSPDSSVVLVHAEFIAPVVAGLVRARIKVRTDSIAEPAVFAYVQATVSKDVEVGARSIDLGPFHAGQFVEELIEVLTRGRLKLADVRCTNRGLEASWKPLDDVGARWSVTVRPKRSLGFGPLRGELILKTVGPQKLEIILPLQGEYCETPVTPQALSAEVLERFRSSSNARVPKTPQEESAPKRLNRIEHVLAVQR